MAAVKDKDKDALIPQYGFTEVAKSITEILADDEKTEAFLGKRRVSLRSANANFCNWGRARSSGTCKCTSGNCSNKMCSCFKNGLLCNTKCHTGRGGSRAKYKNCPVELFDPTHTGTGTSTSTSVTDESTVGGTAAAELFDPTHTGSGTSTSTDESTVGGTATRSTDARSSSSGSKKLQKTKLSASASSSSSSACITRANGAVAVAKPGGACYRD